MNRGSERDELGISPFVSIPRLNPHIYPGDQVTRTSTICLFVGMDVSARVLVLLARGVSDSNREVFRTLVTAFTASGQNFRAPISSSRSKVGGVRKKLEVQSYAVWSYLLVAYINTKETSTRYHHKCFERGGGQKHDCRLALFKL
jgi:hypothetical protein